jgi:hypothetical protein
VVKQVARLTTGPQTTLTLGPLRADGYVILRSGVQWLCSDGHVCRPNEVVGFCNIRLAPSSSSRLASPPLGDERTLQVGLATRAAGRLKVAEGSSAGGYLDVLGSKAWEADEVMAYLDPASDIEAAGTTGGQTFRLLMLAGRRMSWAVDVDTGLLPGWNARARAWWGETGDDGPTVVSLGICDATSVVRGDRAGFEEMFAATDFGAQFVHVSEHPISPCAPFLIEQFTRTASQYDAIATDLKRRFSDDAATPTSEDWIFAGALLTQLGQSPLGEHLERLTPTGLRSPGPADAALLSLSAESGSLLRHKTLGYHIKILDHNRRAGGSSTRAWLSNSFEPVTRNIDDIRRDYERLSRTIGGATGLRVLVLNRMSTSGREDINSYSAFDPPLGETLTYFAAKELNLMLEDLAEDQMISIIDVDAVAAEIGGAEHLPDGIHQSGAMQARLRDELLAHVAEL